MTGMWSRVDGQWKEASRLWSKVDGQWKEASRAWTKVDGQWKQFWPGAPKKDLFLVRHYLQPEKSTPEAGRVGNRLIVSMPTGSSRWLYYSDDQGSTWNEGAFPDDPPVRPLQTPGNDIIVSGPTAGTIFTSFDGITWTEREKINAFGRLMWAKIGGNYVLLSNKTANYDYGLWTTSSFETITKSWSPTQFPNATFANPFIDAEGRLCFFMNTYEETNQVFLMRTSDGANVTQQEINYPSDVYNYPPTLVRSKTGYLCYSENDNEIVFTRDFSTWVRKPAPAQTIVGVSEGRVVVANSQASLGNRFFYYSDDDGDSWEVAGGDQHIGKGFYTGEDLGEQLVIPSGDSVWVSVETGGGVGYTKPFPDASFNTVGNFNGAAGKFLITRKDDTNPEVSLSTDGKTWSVPTSFPLPIGNGVMITSHYDRFVYVNFFDDQNYVSSDGLNWTQLPYAGDDLKQTSDGTRLSNGNYISRTPRGIHVYTPDYSDITYSLPSTAKLLTERTPGDPYVYAINNGNIVKTLDGVTWETVMDANGGEKIARIGANGFLSRNGSSVYYATAGGTWQKVLETEGSLRSNGQQVLNVSKDNMMVSTDGVSWKPVTTAQTSSYSLPVGFWVGDAFAAQWDSYGGVGYYPE